MPSLLFLLLMLVIFVGAFGFMIYCYEADKRAGETKRNHSHDRI